MAEANSSKLFNQAKDETGKVYGKLTVIGQAGKQCGQWLWQCRCECGTETTVFGANLRKKTTPTRSCGKCVHKTVNGLSESPEYRVWYDMKRRCYDPRKRDYKWYGGRGIGVSDSWRDSFLAFWDDMGPRPFPGATIDRIDNDAGYSKENCRWATQEEQKQNTRNVRKLTYNGETMGISAWARKLGIDRSTLRLRLDRGWPLNEVFTPDTSFINRRFRNIPPTG
jgi:hypothetical protein